MKFCYRMMRSWAFRRIRARHVVGWLACEYFEYAVHAPGSAGVRKHAGAHNKGAGGSEGTRARVDMAAPVAISGDRADSGVAAARESTGVTMHL